MTLLLHECIVVINLQKVKIYKWKGDDMIEIDPLEMATKLSSLIENVKEVKSKLSNELSISDQKVADIQHYIESRNLNAVEGFKAYKLLQETLKERRVIKHKMMEIEPLYHTLILNNKMDNKAAEIKKRVSETHKKNKDGRGYNVRVMTSEFGKRIENSV